MFITNKKTFHPGSTTSPNGMVVTTPTEQEFIAAFITTHYAPPTDVQYNEWVCERDQPRELYRQARSGHILGTATARVRWSDRESGRKMPQG